MAMLPALPPEAAFPAANAFAALTLLHERISR